MAALVAFAAQAQDRADRQELTDPDSFTMILLGDPQGYTKYDINQPLFDLCTAWIADSVDHLNIKAVLCTGDLVEQNENIVLNRKMLNQTSREMWEAASHALARLDGKVPYIISPGNHDYGYRKAENSRTCFPDYFPFERNPAWRDVCVATYPNRNGAISLENAAFAFDDPAWGGLLVVTTEFLPRDEVLDWAAALIDKPEYRDRKVIFMTHAFLHERSAKRIEKNSYELTPGNTGAEIWRKLIEPSPNIRMVVCGHTGKPGDYEDAVAYRVDKNRAGHDVHQMMFNVQILGGGWEGNGGDGWLRIHAGGKTITYKAPNQIGGSKSFEAGKTTTLDLRLTDGNVEPGPEPDPGLEPDEEFRNKSYQAMFFACMTRKRSSRFRRAILLTTAHPTYGSSMCIIGVTARRQNPGSCRGAKAAVGTTSTKPTGRMMPKTDTCVGRGLLPIFCTGG